MAVTNYTPLLGLALPTTGDLSGTWGDVVNDSITSLLDSGVAGTTALSIDADVTLSVTNGASNQARNAIILWTATGTATRYITAPAQSKAYIVINATGGTQSIVLRGAGPTTGVTVLAGRKALIAWNGTDFVQVSGGLVNLASDVTGTLPTANGGTGLSGATPFTANGVMFASSASAVATGAGLTFDGTNFGVGNVSTPTIAFNSNNTNVKVDNSLGDLTWYSADASTGSSGIVAKISAAADLNFTSVFGPGLRFYTSGLNPVSLTERMRINTLGNVGIATASPSYILSLGGDSARTFGMEQPTTANTAGKDLTIQAGRATLGATDKSAGNLVLNSGTATGTGSSYITFKTSAAGASGTSDNALTEKMRLDAPGNLGLGITPNNWVVGNTVFQFGGSGFIRGIADYEYAAIGSNMYSDAAGEKYIRGGYASQYVQISGAHFWSTAPSGTAGSPITFTQAMTLSALGGLSLGIPNEAGAGNILLGPTKKLFGNDTSGSYYSSIQLYNNSNGNMELTAAAAGGGITFATGGTTERARIDANGNLIQTVNATAATLATNGTLTLYRIDNTHVGIAMRGSDGVTRTASITVA